ncbi:MAG: hypothetical protein JRD19_05395 [Deltaproteobacteria bacterium]|jgi:hypothetical protein|nr:hypothetical protein [Deltaproteobacteria bacterium]
METLVKDLQKLVPFKDTIETGDIVLIAAQKPQMLVYGLIDDIVRDETKHDEWWHVSMHILSLPPRKVTWILRTPQMTGLEIFTMDGEERFMKAVRFDTKEKQPQKHMTNSGQQSKKKSSLRRIK